jgi:pimeloyl-ACP methyl ester carboxylesterase
MRFVEVERARLALREWGPEGGRPIFFWHALGPVGSGATIGEVATALAASGYRVAAVDGPGFGGSELLPPERYETEPLLALVDGVLAELRWERPVFMGHSWGGALAVHAAARRPFDGLVLLDSGHIDYSALPDVDAGLPWEEWLATARERQAEWPSREAFEHDLREGTTRWSDELLGCFLPGLHETDDGRVAGSPPEARAAAMRGLARSNVSEAWPALAGTPTLLLLATEEPWGSQNRELIERFEAAVPHAEVRWVEGATHAIPADLGPELGDDIADWLDAVGRGSRQD